MADMPKRRFWQIHLSTAIVMMFVASVLVGLNWGGGQEYKIDGHIYRSIVGWPIRYRYDYLTGTTDVLISVTILILTAWCCEFRRREE